MSEKISYRRPSSIQSGKTHDIRFKFLAYGEASKNMRTEIDSTTVFPTLKSTKNPIKLEIPKTAQIPIRGAFLSVHHHHHLYLESSVKVFFDAIK
ncbi:hypothetical protein Scep_010809 [Stephania cephalantha]|uniref:Uncharacterized protein n=1 Tax=Stephania cephalantha TaxID=152367 RepID=A0AAP0PDN0_9MAGN